MEHAGDLARWSAEVGVPLQPSQIESFLVYLGELLRWNEKTNLTAIRTPKDIILKHFVDSLACFKAIGASDRQRFLLDIGAGAGFPGIPLKLVDPDLHVTLLEPSLKKTAFLHHTIGTLRLSGVRVISQTLERYAVDPARDTAYARAITRALNIWPSLHHARRLLVDDGVLILCRSTPFQGKLHGFAMETELAYELPAHAGRRVLSLLRPVSSSPGLTVPRGT